jgi:hypothetical protein
MPEPQCFNTGGIQIAGKKTVGVVETEPAPIQLSSAAEKLVIYETGHSIDVYNREWSALQPFPFHFGQSVSSSRPK